MEQSLPQHSVAPIPGRGGVGVRGHGHLCGNDQTPSLCCWPPYPAVCSQAASARGTAHPRPKTVCDFSWNDLLSGDVTSLKPAPWRTPAVPQVSKSTMHIADCSESSRRASHQKLRSRPWATAPLVSQLFPGCTGGEVGGWEAGSLSNNRG